MRIAVVFLLLILVACSIGCFAFHEGPAFAPQTHSQHRPVSSNDYDVEFRDERTATSNATSVRVPAKTGAFQGDQIEVSSSTVATLIRDALYQNLDLPISHHVVVDVRRITTGWSTYEFREVAFAAVDLDLTVTSSAGPVARLRASSWGNDGRPDSSRSIVANTLFTVLRRAIDDAFCCGARDQLAAHLAAPSSDVITLEPLSTEPPPEAFRAFVSGPLNTWGWMLGLGATFSGLPGSDRSLFRGWPGSRIESSFGGSIETLVRFPLDGLRFGYGFRSTGGVVTAPWKSGLSDDIGFETSSRKTAHLIVESRSGFRSTSNSTSSASSGWHPLTCISTPSIRARRPNVTFARSSSRAGWPTAASVLRCTPVPSYMVLAA